MKSAGLILAAGESRRMGSPKALLEYRGETFLDRLVRMFAERCETVIVVLGAGAEEIRSKARLQPDCRRYAVNPDYQNGQTSSMQCGLRAVPPDADGVLFTLVDHPGVREDTVERLTDDELRSSVPLVRVPRFQAKRGHPIWFAKELIPEFLALPVDGAARDVVRAHADRTEFLDLDDPGIVADIDDPGAYRALRGMEA